MRHCPVVVGGVGGGVEETDTSRCGVCACVHMC